MKIVILGASSYVGARLYIDLKKEYEVIGTFFSNKLSEDFVFLNITDSQAVRELIRIQKPDVIIHVANNASRAWCDCHPEEALELNQNATKFIVAAAQETGAKLIYVSSFAATADTLYGQTKKHSEDIIIESGVCYCIIRPSLIIGLSPNTVNDRPFNKILKSLKAGTRANFDSSWKFQPTSINHLSAVIREIIHRNIDSRTINVACPEIVSRYKLAKDILAPFGIKVERTSLRNAVIITEQSLLDLKELHLPFLNYPDSVKEIIQAIKHRDQFTL